jgi:hypothetical protein
MTFDISVGVKRTNRELLEQLNAGLDREQPRIHTILEGYFVPLVDPLAHLTWQRGTPCNPSHPLLDAVVPATAQCFEERNQVGGGGDFSLIEADMRPVSSTDMASDARGMHTHF